MCGIMGYVGSRPASEILIQGLKRLEYRGYDSAGIALFLNPKIEIKKSEGRLQNVEKLLKGASQDFLDSTCGIGHTRWATHGKPTTQNAHPHQTGHVVIVHNGIIENYIEIKKDLLLKGYQPISDTDSELFGFLVLEEMEKGHDLKEAVRNSFRGIRGQCSVVVMSEKEPGVLVGVRNGSPLVAAVDPKGGIILASDSQPLIPFNSEVIFLEHGDLVVGNSRELKFFDLNSGKHVERQRVKLDWSEESLDKGGFPHFMLKEIHEQPEVITNTFNSLIDKLKFEPFSLADQPGLKILAQAQELVLVACGTSWHAALLGKYWIERWAKIPVNVELASEFRYREPFLRAGSVILGISQSGETADTLAVLREVKKKGFSTLAITNVRGSTISREVDATFYSSAGPEIGVAATKTFLVQLLVLFILSGYLGILRKQVPVEELTQPFKDLIRLPDLIAKGLKLDSPMMTQAQIAANSLQNAKGYFFIGRGFSYPIALEGALKLKEIAYDYAEGYAAGELKHGPIAMIDQGMVVVVLAPRDPWRDKTVSNLEEVKARGATIVGIGDSQDQDLKNLCDYWIPLPSEAKSIDSVLLPFLLTPVIQLFSYFRATLKGTDVDKPRNLAKSVTVE